MKIPYLLASARSRRNRRRFPGIAGNYPYCERVERNETIRHTRACSYRANSPAQTGTGLQKRRRAGQPLDERKKRADPVDRSRYEGEVCANIISVVLRRESFHIDGAMGEGVKANVTAGFGWLVGWLRG